MDKPSFSIDGADSLTDKLNKISAALADKIDTAQDITVKGDDVVKYMENGGISGIAEHPDNYLDAFNVQSLLQDFAFIRETLRDNANCGKALLSSLTTDISIMEPDELAQLVNSFAELNRSITDNLKLYIHAYKELSNMVINLQRGNISHKSDGQEQNVVTNNIIMSTSDILNRIKTQD